MTGGCGVVDLLEAVEELEVCVVAGGFGTVPEVVSDDGTILAGEGNNDEEVPRAAEVLALGTLILGTGTTAGVIGRASADLAARVSLAWTVEG